MHGVRRYHTGGLAAQCCSFPVCRWRDSPGLSAGSYDDAGTPKPRIRDSVTRHRPGGRPWQQIQTVSTAPILPPPEPPFGGKIEVAFKDSQSDFPEPLRARRRARPTCYSSWVTTLATVTWARSAGPARTPVFDRLAAQGLIFSNFHTTPVCSASRAAVLTGRNSHSVGMGCIPEASVGFPGYNAVIPRSAATVLEILRQNGYGTAWIGKTHLTPIHEITAAGPFDRWPMGMGAEYFYGFFGAGVSQWYPPLWENSTPTKADKTPDEGYHLEADMADKTIAFINRQKSIHPEKPWIAYYAPNGHKPPVGVPDEFIDRYRGEFDDGYDALRDRILARQKELGIVRGRHQARAPARRRCRRGTRSPTPTRRSASRWMEVFCGAVEFTDHQIGRIVEAIEADRRAGQHPHRLHRR